MGFKGLTIAAALVAVLALPGAASAQNGHFLGDQTCTDIGTQVSCSGRVAGLGSGTFRIEVDADGVATVACTSPGGNVAPGQSFTFTSEGTTGDLPAPKNGSFRYSGLKTVAPTAPADACPNSKWTATVTDVQFTSATLSLFENATLSDTATVPVS